MSEGSFWKIYFVLLHPRLESQAAELLSTPEVSFNHDSTQIPVSPNSFFQILTLLGNKHSNSMQIVKARASLTREMKDRSKLQTNEVEVSGDKFPYSEPKPENVPGTSGTRSELESESAPLESESESSPLETEKHPIPTEDIQVVDKSVIQEEPRHETKPKPKPQVQNVVEANDEDDWLKEETSEHTIPIPIDNDEDVSFSDLEDDDGPESSMKESRDWVQLGESSGDSGGGAKGKESNDWLDVDDIDVA